MSRWLLAWARASPFPNCTVSSWLLGVSRGILSQGVSTVHFFNFNQSKPENWGEGAPKENEKLSVLKSKEQT